MKNSCRGDRLARTKRQVKRRLGIVKKREADLLDICGESRLATEPNRLSKFNLDCTCRRCQYGKKEGRTTFRDRKLSVTKHQLSIDE